LVIEIGIATEIGIAIEIETIPEGFASNFDPDFDRDFDFDLALNGLAGAIGASSEPNAQDRSTRS